MLSSNHLIDAMALRDRDAILSLATRIELRPGAVLSEAGDCVGHVHFPIEGVVSAISHLADGRAAEAYMTGSEGALSVFAALVDTQPRTRHQVQVGGQAWRVDAAAMRRLTGASAAMRDLLLTYAAELHGEVKVSLACNALHGAEQRLAKWLLRCHDRVSSDVLPLTQEFLGIMLGSQRTTVNQAAQDLQAGGAIRYSRGKVRVVDRIALERAACDCYRAPFRVATGLSAPLTARRA